jgi:hypothetical protein
MSEQGWFNGVALVLVLVVVVGFLAGLGLGGNSGSTSSGGGSASSGPAPYNVTLWIGANINNGHDEVFPANFTVPAGVPVHVTIFNYDQGINNEAGLPVGVSHTFTIASLGIHVALLAANATQNDTPTEGSFTYTFNPGEYQWNCMAPCDPWSMLTSGYMQGVITAV